MNHRTCSDATCAFNAEFYQNPVTDKFHRSHLRWGGELVFPVSFASRALANCLHACLACLHSHIRRTKQEACSQTLFEPMCNVIVRSVFSLSSCSHRTLENTIILSLRVLICIMTQYGCQTHTSTLSPFHNGVTSCRCRSCEAELRRSSWTSQNLFNTLELIMGYVRKGSITRWMKVSMWGVRKVDSYLNHSAHRFFSIIL